MAKPLRLIGGLFASCLLVVGAQAEAPSLSEGAKAGALVIAGGGLGRETEDVWRAFVANAKGEGDIVIVPSASGSPASSASGVQETLFAYGVAADRVSIARLAVRDDRSTPETNEARWARNYDDPDTVEQLRSAAAIWFTGGDQSRTTEVLLKSGAETPALQAIRSAHTAGAPIGGTSAGAAIMSRQMMLQGDSLSALTGSAEGEPLEIGPGLGFFEHGFVDQHFGERARLGRLVAALAKEADPNRRIGFGVDEDTALIVGSDGTATVGGSGYVAILDARQARFRSIHGDRLRATGLTLHLIAAGDQVDLETLAMTPASWKSATVGNEYFENALPGGGGMAVQGQRLANVIGDGLVDNQSASEVDRVSFDGKGRGVAYAFTQRPETAGFWGRGPDGEGRYAIANVRFDIVPVDVAIALAE